VPASLKAIEHRSAAKIVPRQLLWNVKNETKDTTNNKNAKCASDMGKRQSNAQHITLVGNDEQ